MCPVPRHYLAFVLLSRPAVAQDARAVGVRRAALAYMSGNKVAGLSMALLENGRIVFADGYGFADREAGRRASVGTMYRLGSISKPVTALAVMRLAQRGSVGLDKEVRGYAPEYPAKPWPITVRQVLTHLGHSPLPARQEGRRRPILHERRGAAAVRRRPLLFEPGTKYSYSTHAYTVLARLVETAGARISPTHVRQNIVPFAGPSLDCELLTDRKPERSALYSVRGGALVRETKREDNSWKFGGGGFESNAVDLAYLAYSTLTGRVVSRSTREAMWTPATLKDAAPRSTAWVGASPGMDAWGTTALSKAHRARCGSTRSMASWSWCSRTPEETGRTSWPTTSGGSGRGQGQVRGWRLEGRDGRDVRCEM